MAQLSSLAITDDGDLDITGSTFSISEDADTIRDQTSFRLQLVEGDWFLDILEGIAYFTEVFGKKEIDDSMEDQFKLQILGTQGVTELLSIDFELDANRSLNIDFTENTIFGEVDFSIPLTL